MSEHVLVASGLAMDDHGHRPLLLPTTFRVDSGELLVAAGDPGHGHTMLALALAGRLSGHHGHVRMDGHRRPRPLQDAVALVDVPGVSEPDDAVPVHTIVGEELAMARKRAGRGAVRQWLTANGFAEHHGLRMEELPTGIRLPLLARLAAQRADVRFLVAVLPERHGGLADEWLAVMRELAAAGYGVVVTTSMGVAAGLHERVIELGNAAHDEPAAPPEHEPGEPEDETDDVDEGGLVSEPASEPSRTAPRSTGPTEEVR